MNNEIRKSIASKTLFNSKKKFVEINNKKFI
jgi:hypothetical protein